MSEFKGFTLGAAGHENTGAKAVSECRSHGDLVRDREVMQGTKVVCTSCKMLGWPMPSPYKKQPVEHVGAMKFVAGLMVVVGG